MENMKNIPQWVWYSIFALISVTVSVLMQSGVFGNSETIIFISLAAFVIGVVLTIIAHNKTPANFR